MVSKILENAPSWMTFRPFGTGNYIIKCLMCCLYSVSKTAFNYCYCSLLFLGSIILCLDKQFDVSVSSDQHWSVLVSSGQPWSELFSTVQNCSALVSSDQQWSALVNSGQNCSALVNPGQNWSALVSPGQNWSVLVRSALWIDSLVVLGIEPKLVEEQKLYEC